ncbi:MAG TPA: cadherin-like beta sandwich domain-containing protein, partial [Polyangiales bacterium]
MSRLALRSAPATARLRAAVASLCLLGGLAACTSDSDHNDSGSGERADGGGDAGDGGTSPDGGTGETAVFTLGAACSQNAVLGCTGSDSAVSVICSAGIWSPNATCRGAERCDTRLGRTQGQCLDLIAECADKAPGDAFCRGAARLTCGADRVTETADACATGFGCTDDSGTVSCKDIAECASDNGGCDALVTCMENIGAPPDCGKCPEGYVGSGETGCSPTLTALALSKGTLSPELRAKVTSYSVRVGIGTQTVTLTPSVPAGASLTINGSAARPGDAWLSPVLSLGDNVITVVVSKGDQPERRYTVTITRGMQQEAYVKASNTGETDFFGYGVSLSADGNTLAVGAYGEDSNGTGVNSGTQADDSALYSGAVYVFTRSGITWSQQAYVKASNTGANDGFGYAVSLSADGNTLAVGAYREDSNGTGVNSGTQADDSATNSGAVYVFTRSGISWSQQAYVKASNTGAGDVFGSAVALSADGNALAVGACRE